MTLFALPDDQVALRDTARAFADDRVAPHALAWDAAKHVLAGSGARPRIG